MAYIFENETGRFTNALGGCIAFINSELVCKSTISVWKKANEEGVEKYYVRFMQNEIVSQQFTLSREGFDVLRTLLNDVVEQEEEMYDTI